MEGRPSGNDGRTGNVDRVTLAPNLRARGAGPVVGPGDTEPCDRLPVHPRPPYAGPLTAFAMLSAVNRAAR